MIRKFIIMGVAGCGKTTIGEKLAADQNWHFKDGDVLHPKANIDKMAAGIPLSDEDRYPWLKRIGKALAEDRQPVIIGCSALKRKYRDLIRQTVRDKMPVCDKMPEHENADAGAVADNAGAADDNAGAVADNIVCFIFLNGSRELIEKRMSAREGHFMPLSLLDSQFAALEIPAHDECHLDIDIDGDMPSILNDIISQLEVRSACPKTL